MDNTENKIATVEKDLMYFEKMINGAEKLIRPWKVAVLALITCCALTVGAFIWYLNQYDFTGTSTIEATGIYALVDSDGNVIAEDVTPEMWEKYERWLADNGNGQKDSNQEED